MHIEFLVEEPSAEATLKNLVPTILGGDISFAVHPFQGKTDLLKNLSARLRGYGHWLPQDWRIVVLVDADNDDCRELKMRLEDAARHTGLMTKSGTREGQRFQVLNRLAIEELEAWFFGDIEALHSAYPRLPLSLAMKSKYCDSDAIVGGTWEALERELQRAGYYRSGLDKTTAAREISANMSPGRNRSKSFRVFHQGLLAISAQ